MGGTNAVGAMGEIWLEGSLAEWLMDGLGDPGPFLLRPLAGGNSNETSLLVSATGRWILRRPPATRISDTANNLARERRVLTALHDREVPAPRVLAYTEDASVTPVPCLVLEHCPGTPLADSWPPGWPIGPATIGAAGRAAVTSLASVHAVDWRDAGLRDFGRPDGYLVGQVARWRAQYERNQVRDLPLFEQIGAWLDGNRPPESASTLIHGDFHLDNCLFLPGPPVQVSAIIDWELATIGDPLIDLGLLLAFWGSDRPRSPALPHVQALSRQHGAPSRAELAALYAETTGRSVEALGFYMTLAFFKLSAIVEGAYAQYLSGRVNSDYARRLSDDVPGLLAEAARFADIA
jgi:aminoglycoside phosphotransferase (APT) family kinase protein